MSFGAKNPPETVKVEEDPGHMVLFEAFIKSVAEQQNQNAEAPASK